MSEKTRDELKSYFQSGKRPTGQQFADLIDSVLNTLEDGVGTDSNNNLGIGIATPNARLHVFNEQSDGLLIESGNWPEWTMISNPNDHRSKITLDPVSGALQFRLGQGNTGVDGVGDSKLVIDQNGNVGIGTDSPTHKFEVYSGPGGSVAPMFSMSSSDQSITGINTSLTLRNSNLTNGNWARLHFSNGNNSGGTSIATQFQDHSQNAMTADLVFITKGDGNYTEKLRISGNGNVGIGTNSPQAKLHIQQSDIGTATGFASVIIKSIDAHLDIISSDAGTWGSGINLIEGSGNTNTDIWSIIRTTSVFSTPGLRIKYGDHATSPTNNPDLVAITPEGNLGIGTNNPNAKLVIGNIGPNDDVKMLGFGEGGTAGAWFASGFAPNDGENRVKFMSVYGSLMTWKFNGNVGVGNTNPSVRLDVNGTIRYDNLQQNSDHRLKKHIKNINKNTVSQLRELRGVSYQYKKKAGEAKAPDQRRNFGFIAQEVRAIFPDLVYEDHEGMLSLSYTGLIPVLTEAVKAQNETIKELKATNKKRDKTIEELKQDNKKQQDIIKKLNERLAKVEAQLGKL